MKSARTIATLTLACLLMTPTAAYAGGTGHDSCPAGLKSYIIPDAGATTDEHYTAKELHLMKLPAGNYTLVATGQTDSGQADAWSSGTGAYGALCGQPSSSNWFHGGSFTIGWLAGLIVAFTVPFVMRRRSSAPRHQEPTS